MRSSALAVLAGCELVLHPGDVGGPAILRALGAIAPAVAVRGNDDHAPGARRVWRFTHDERQRYYALMPCAEGSTCPAGGAGCRR